MSINKRKIKSTSINNQTGEIHETVTVQTEHVYRRPVNGYKGVYMKKLSDIVELSKSAQRLFFALVHNVDDYNKIMVKWKETLNESDATISRAKKELVTQGFIAKIGKSWVLNPFVVLPRYQTQAPELQNAVQMIYRRYVENMNDWYEGIDEDMEELYN